MSQSRFDVLFEPVQIGPVTSPNRFYQVPHCNSFGHVRPHSEAANRRVKAEGGWGVICTQEVEIHPSSEISPFAEGRLWDDADIPAMALTTDAIHSHGSLAAVELVYNGHHAPNRYSRIAPMTVSAMPVDSYDPVHARAMTKRDIRDLRGWYVDAARRAKSAGFDIVYVYAGHDMSLLQHYLAPRYNQRTDEYGGSLANRLRLLQETLIDVKDAVGDQCGIALRFAVDELIGTEGLQADGEAYEMVSILAELPDLWDVNISDWSNDSSTARFEPQEGYQEKFTAFVKTVTSKPVVGVGRFTSADTMLSQINRGVLDLIGAARPSIADPFLPNKIKEGRLEDIRECIGCNICVASDNIIAPIRCTQNPTAGEEWKRGWHPERIAPAVSAVETLVVGAGPAGLECALQLARRGHQVSLAEASTALGGRALRESKLPGLSSYRRVADYRIGQLQRMPNVQLLPDNCLTAEDVADSGINHVFVATGSHWRRDGVGRQHRTALPLASASVVTPDDLLNSFDTDGSRVSGTVLVYDDDHYYMGGVIAEYLAAQGCTVTLATPAARVSEWTEHTMEIDKIQASIYAAGIEVLTNTALVSAERGTATVEHVHSGRQHQVTADTVCLVTSRIAADALYQALSTLQLKTLTCVGDSEAPGTVAAAVYAGHLAARRFQNEEAEDRLLFRRELTAI
jgi:dimethylamine/trimethylamine dehydrogenase